MGGASEPRIEVWLACRGLRRFRRPQHLYSFLGPCIDSSVGFDPSRGTEGVGGDVLGGLDLAQTSSIIDPCCCASSMACAPLAAGVSRGLGIEPGGKASLHQGPRQAARGRRGAAAKRGAGSKGAQSKGTDGTGQDGTGEGDADEAAAADGRGAAKPATGTEDGGKEGDWSADRVGDTDQGGEGNEEMDGDEEGPGSMQPSGSGEVAGDGMDEDGADQAHDAADDDADDDDSAAHGQPDLLQPLSDASGGHAAITAHAAAESGGNDMGRSHGGGEADADGGDMLVDAGAARPSQDTGEGRSGAAGAGGGDACEAERWAWVTAESEREAEAERLERERERERLLLAAEREEAAYARHGVAALARELQVLQGCRIGTAMHGREAALSASCAAPPESEVGAV